MYMCVYNRKYWRVPALLVCLLCAMPSSHAVGPGTRSAEFLSIYSDARPSAMGDAYTALAENAAGLAFNPAGLMKADQREISASYVGWLEGGHFQHLAYTHPIGRSLNAFGVSLLYFNPGAFKQTNNLGIETGNDLEAMDLAVTFGYARRLHNFGLIGISAKYIRRELHDKQAHTYAIDAGLLYKPFKAPLEIGFVIQNLGEKLTFINAKEQLPFTVRAGISYPLYFEYFRVAADVIKVRDEAPAYAVGAEWNFGEVAFLRAGWKKSTGLRKGWSGGAGFKYKALSLDYSYVPFEIFGGTHRVTLNWKFGGSQYPEIVTVPSHGFPQEKSGTKTSKQENQSPGWRVTGDNKERGKK